MSRLLLVCGLLASGCAEPGQLSTGGSNKDMKSSSNHDGSTTTTGDGGTTTGPRMWTDISYPTTQGGYLWSVWNSGSGTVLTVGDYGTVLRSTNGSAFAPDTSMTPAMPALLSVNGAPGASPPELFIAGYGGALWKWSGADVSTPSTWAPDAPGVGNDLLGVWTAPDGMAFAVGKEVFLQRKTSGTYSWTTLTGGPTTGDVAYGVWGIMTGTGQYQVWAVGCQLGDGTTTTGCGKGMIWRTDGSGTVTSEASGTSEALYAVWGSSATDIYAVGDIGTLLHSTGDGKWVPQNSGATTALEGIGGSGPDEIYVVGDPDTKGILALQKLDQTKTYWDRITLPTTATPKLIGASATTSDVYLTGQNGAIFHY